jgi:hypothetical protein
MYNISLSVNFHRKPLFPQSLFDLFTVFVVQKLDTGKKSEQQLDVVLSNRSFLLGFNWL